MYLTAPSHNVQVVFCVTGFKGVLSVLFSWLAEVEGGEGPGALAIEDGPCTFTEARGLLGYSKCSDNSQIIRKGAR